MSSGPPGLHNKSLSQEDGRREKWERDGKGNKKERRKQAQSRSRDCVPKEGHPYISLLISSKVRALVEGDVRGHGVF